jgi:hypothetical protein
VRVPSKHEGDTGYIRPLTDAELRQLVKSTVTTPHPELLDKPDAMKLAIDFMVHTHVTSLQHRGVSSLTYKGSQVILIAKC